MIFPAALGHQGPNLIHLRQEGSNVLLLRLHVSMQLLAMRCHLVLHGGELGSLSCGLLLQLSFHLGIFLHDALHLMFQHEHSVREIITLHWHLLGREATQDCLSDLVFKLLQASSRISCHWRLGSGFEPSPWVTVEPWVFVAIGTIVAS